MRPILVYRIGALGDALVSLPAMFELRRLYPGSPIYLLTELSKADNHVSIKHILGKCVDLSDVIEYDPSKKMCEVFKIAREVRRFRPSSVFYLSPLRKSWLQVARDYLFFRFVCGINELSGFSHALEERGLDFRTGREADRLMDIVTEGHPSGCGSVTIAFSDQEKERAAHLLGPLTRENGARLVAVCPGSKMPAKRWPLERFSELGKKLLADKTVRLVVIGDKNDLLIANALVREWGERCINCAGSTTIFESAAVLSNCELYIGNDTGAMHLASLVGVPCIALFSARDTVGKWHPIGENNIILRANVDCSGCMLETCTKGNACLNAISVEQVLEAYRNFREHKAGKRQTNQS